jgi:hypothetical protein
MNITKRKDIERLTRIIHRDYRSMAKYRTNRRQLEEQIAGSHYGSDGPEHDVPVNFLALAAQVIVNHLAARDPAVLIDAQTEDLKPKASTFTLAVNHLIEHELHMGIVFAQAARNAMTGVGVIKTAMNLSGVEIGGEWVDIGQPFSMVVDTDDLVISCHESARLDDLVYIGDRHKLRLDRAKESPLYIREKIEKLADKSQRDKNPDGTPKMRTLSVGEVTDEDTVDEYIWVVDVYLPREKKFITLPYSEGEVDTSVGQLRPDDLTDWQGPEDGPYRVLGFEWIPGNILPKPVMASGRLLHEVGNKLFRKLTNQAQRQKSIGTYDKRHAQDAEVIKAAKDGEIVGLNGGRIEEARFGGPDQVNLAMFLQVQSLFNWFMGNIESLAGLSAQSDTLGQDQLLAAGASTKIKAMQHTMLEFATGVVRDLAWYLWTDPLIDLPLTKRVAGTDITVPTRFSPEEMEGDFLEYNFSIQPYSMQQKSPELILQTMEHVLNSFVGPFLPMMEQQGLAINVEKLLRRVGELTNIDMDDLVTFAGGPKDPEVASVGQARQSPVTTRNYTRTNIPGKSRDGSAQAMATALLGGNPQQSEAAAMFR